MQLGCVRLANVELLARQAKDAMRRLKLTTLKLRLTHLKECVTEDQILNHNLINILFFKIDELGLVGKCVDHSFRIYMGCYLQFCITKTLQPVNEHSSKVHFFHILRAHAKGLTKTGRSTCEAGRHCYLALSLPVGHLLYRKAMAVGPASVWKWHFRLWKIWLTSVMFCGF